MPDQTYTIIVNSSEFSNVVEKDLTIKEIEYYCKSFLDKGEWVEAFIVENKSTVSFDAEQE